MYRLRTLGGAALLRDGSPVDSAGAQRKLLALLALLAMARQRGISRDRLASFLWSESSEDRSRNALKQALHVLRRQLGTDAVPGTAELRLNPAYIETDVDEFLAAVEAGDYGRAVALYGGPFLDGFHLSGAAEFERWADEQRATLARHHARALEELAHEAQRRGAHAEAAALWRRLQAQDPLHARAAVGLIEALDAAGERPAALRAGQSYEALIRDELGAAADPAVTEVMHRLRSEPPAPRPRPPTDSGRASDHTDPPVPSARPTARTGRRLRHAAALVLLTAATAAGAAWIGSYRGGESVPAAASPGASLAVVPFVNTGPDGADDHLSDGLTDELISRLGQVAGMRVAARTSTFALKGRGLSAREIADTLAVATVLDGTVRRTGDRLQISARLVDARSDRVLWSEAYDRRLAEVFAVQEEIARAIVGALTQLPPPAPTSETVRPTADLEAYDLYLRGKYGWGLPARERFEQAVRYHRRAVERDPAFAAAYAALAETYVNLAVYGYRPPGEALARARVASEQALALNPDLVEAMTSHAYVLMTTLAFDDAEAELRRAIALNPSYPWSHHFMSLLLMMVGEPAAALPHNRQALALDPLSLPANATRGIIQAQLGDYAAAAAELERARQLAPDFTLTLYYLGGVRAAQGSYTAALELLEDASRQAPEYPGLRGALALVQRRLGRAGAADSILAALEQRSGDPRGRANLAFAHGMMGRNDAAFAALDSIGWDVPSLIGLRADPLLKGLRSDPRYRGMLERAGARRGTAPDPELTGR